MNPNHLDEVTCLLYLEGQLERERALELSAHTERCADCRALLRALASESRLLAHALVEEDEAVPARLLAPPARDTTPWLWIISFGLAAAGAYTLWTGFIEPWQQQLSQAGVSSNSLLTLLFFRGAFWKGWREMANMIQLLAAASLGLLAIFLLRRTWRRWTTLAIVLSTLVAALALPPAASATDVPKGKQTYTLSAGETIKTDLILGTGTARIDGTVEGDLIVFCQSLTVTGHVTGDVIAFSQLLRINGAVDGNVRAFANTVTISSTVARNVSAFAQTFELDPKGQVNGSLLLFAEAGNLDGRIGRDVMMATAHSQVNGYVGGDAQLRGDRLSIGSTAQIAGKASFRGHNKPEVAPGAHLASPLEVEIVTRRPEYTKPNFYWWQALAWAAAFVFGLVLVLLMPGFFDDVVHSARRYGPAFGFGALTFIAWPILALIACVTIVGLAPGLSAIMVWAVALYSAQVIIGAWVGQALLGPATSSSAVIGRMALGLLLLRIAGALPYVGGWIKFLYIIWAFGALALAIYRRTRPQAPGSIPIAPPPTVTA